MSHATRLHLQNRSINTGILLAVIACLFSIFQPAQADNTERHLQVTETEGVYRIHVSQVLDVDAHYVHDVLTDVMHVYRLNPSIIESEILGSHGDNGIRIRTKLLTCLPVFCREVERVDIISVLASGVILAELIPEQSDFLSGKAEWKVTPLEGHRTHLAYEAYIEPGFFIPPIIGVQVVKNNLNKEFGVTFDRIERIATVNTERDWHHELHSTQLALKSSPSEPCKKSLSANLQ